MNETMTVTMDSAGRLVLPKQVRSSLGLEPGQRLRVAVRDDRVELAPMPIEASLAEESGVLVIVPQEPVATLSHKDVRDAVDRGRK
ncbi:MAG: AbrB/MazE/SpoVT family DNA-binding domain-containing protein [Acidimicrobiales bacterium]